MEESCFAAVSYIPAGKGNNRHIRSLVNTDCVECFTLRNAEKPKIVSSHQDAVGRSSLVPREADHVKDGQHSKAQISLCCATKTQQTHTNAHKEVIQTEK